MFTASRFLSIFTLMACSSLLYASEDTSCKQIKMGVANWTDVMATSAIAKQLLGELGYNAKQTFASESIILAGLKDKKLDLFLGYWDPLMNAEIQTLKDNQQIKVSPTPNLTNANATLAVPHYLFDQGLKTFADIGRFKDALGGKIYGIEAGSATNQQIQAMIDKDQFGLKGFKIVESSEAGMLAELQRAVNRKSPIVFFGWAPHPMNVNFDINYLTGSQDALGPQEGAATVWTVTTPEFDQRCPNVQRLLNQLTFTTATESQMMVSILNGQKPEDMARDWIKNHPEDHKRWVEGITTFTGKPYSPDIVQQ
ncbi:MAG: glycine/betaine transporter substrate-binding protein [Pseudomonas sp.]|nr:glycine/betaine transporter substrate-binding protein [Pseudomonas sp.]